MNNFLFLQNIGAGEVVIIALVILLIFGGKKIPELMKGLGKGVKSFKQGMEEAESEISKSLEDKPKKAEEKSEEKKSE
ncbi:MAG: twin-arginine translocase TatA/TatE family subunit [Bacteroidales bacterium]|nr:twin-arginine translocase TatA/TatE family subunit [Bacteroidales bacterium]